ncbi:MAG: hypothetical protein QOH95_93 [Gaiellaceae bacterium]|nr:hypothetical protein [Gaiellaceae bacterium]
MKALAAAIALVLVVVPAASGSERATLLIGNGAQPFAGDRADLATISPNGDGFRDAATIQYTAPTAGFARLRVDRADRKGTVFVDDAIPVAAGASNLSWSPAAGTAPGTYVVRVSSSGSAPVSGVVRVQGIDVAAGHAGYAPGDVALISVATDATQLRVDVLHIDASSFSTAGNSSVNGTAVAPTQIVQWSHVDGPHNIAVPVGNWQSGVYFVRVTSTDGRVGFAPFVLRPRRLGVNHVAVILPTNTWQAYNFYDRNGDGRGDTWYAAWHVHRARLGRPFLNNGIPEHFRLYDLRFLAWAATHVHADYLTDVDLERVRSGSHLARLYDFVAFPGHHEYVTQREYDIVRDYRDLGGNLAWLSANNFFWKVVRHGPELERVAQWRTLGRPEASLIGVQYRGNDEGQRRGPMQPVPAAAPWLFAGTQMERGLPWGSFGIEIDHTAPSSPAGTTVVASVPDLYGPGFTAQMTYYETPAGAKVFAAGAFSLAVAAHKFVGARVLSNLFDHMKVP